MEEEIGKPRMTKEELAKDWKEYYDWLLSIYHVESFDIQGKNEEILHFYHGFNHMTLDNEDSLSYFLVDDEYYKYLQEQKDLHLQGEEMPEDEKRKYKSKGYILIDKDKKYFDFSINWDYQRNGYGTTIYDNISHILEMLGIEDKEQYEIRVNGNPNHEFFKRLETKRLVAKSSGEPNTENALQVIEEFAKHCNKMSFGEFNTIIEYALNSNISMEKIAEAINENGFKIFYSDINGTPCFYEDDFKKFKSFGIKGIKATCMHHHFIRAKNFGFLQLLDDVDMEDATLEFRRIFEEVKKEHEKRKSEGGYISPNLEKFGELEHIILDWEHSGLLFKNTSPEIQTLVKKQAISKFDEFDPEHSEAWSFNLDFNSERTLKMLSDAGLMDKDTYIALYQKALNRNYDLDEFDNAMCHFIDDKQRKKARQEIFQNVYYPSPKGNWQKSHSWGENHRISKVTIPQRVSKKGKVRDILKQEILRQGTAKSTKIKTDMTGIGKDGKTFKVDNLKDWLFGVPGAHGNLQIIGNTVVTFPPQTPKYAVELIEQAFNSLEHPDFVER